MDRKTLKQYRALKRELVLIDQGIEELQRRAERIPTVRGKVTGSSPDWPYLETHFPVEMDEPKEADKIRRRLRIKESRKAAVSRLVVEIEEFIAGIPNSIDRQIFEMCFLQGKRQREAADIVGMERSNISVRIGRVLQDSHNSQKKTAIIKLR